MNVFFIETGLDGTIHPLLDSDLVPAHRGIDVPGLDLIPPVVILSRSQKFTIKANMQ
jgi:hypothetical protein